MTTLTKISTLGKRLDLELHQGASLLPVRHTLYTDEAKTTPLDLTGATVRGQIRRTALATSVAANFRTALAPTPADGWYEFWLTDEDTGAIPCGAKLTDPDSVYEYDIELETLAGDVRVTFYGTARIKAGATRP